MTAALQEPKHAIQGTSVYDVFRHGHQEGSRPINLTIGNPHLKPPPCYYKAMQEVMQEMQNEPCNCHGYMTQDDPFGLCHSLASDLGTRFDTPFQKENILITVGATGALDVILKTLIHPPIDTKNPEKRAKKLDEVIVIAPYFVEYLNIIQGNSAKAVVVPSAEDFGLDPQAIEKAITSKTCAIIINSPNNPTGKIYTQGALNNLAQVLKKKSREIGHPIIVIEDSVYDTIIFKYITTPSLIPYYSALIRVNSYSKSLSLAGERLGYLAVHPLLGSTDELQSLMTALNLNMRVRVVHAPLLQHRIVARMPLHGLIDINPYRRNMDTLYNTLSRLGFAVQEPEGTFYLWAILPSQFKSEQEFRERALTGPSPLLYLPGSLFGGDAYSRCVRFSTCAPHSEIERACQRLQEICTQTIFNP